MIIPPNLYTSNFCLLLFYPLFAPTTMPLPDIYAQEDNILEQNRSIPSGNS